MSILIKDMEMPEKCGACNLFHAESPMYCMAIKKHKVPAAPYGLPRPDWCPLEEQPEEDCDSCKHGHFGDRQCDNCRVRYPSHYERRTDG